MSATPEKLLVYDAAAQICQALANPRRYAIMQALTQAHEVSVAKLRELTDASRSSLTQHTSILSKAGLIAVIPKGRFRSYTLACDEIAHVLEAVTEVLARRRSHDEALQKEMAHE